MANTLDFSGKAALITGAAAGMGLATARAFAEAGAAVVLADFKEDAVKAAAAEHSRGMGPSHRGEPAGRLELHEARASADGTPEERGHRQ